MTPLLNLHLILLSPTLVYISTERRNKGQRGDCQLTAQYNVYTCDEGLKWGGGLPIFNTSMDNISIVGRNINGWEGVGDCV